MSNVPTQIGTFHNSPVVPILAQSNFLESDHQLQGEGV